MTCINSLCAIQKKRRRKEGFHEVLMNVRRLRVVWSNSKKKKDVEKIRTRVRPSKCWRTSSCRPNACANVMVAT